MSGGLGGNSGGGNSGSGFGDGAVAGEEARGRLLDRDGDREPPHRRAEGGGRHATAPLGAFEPDVVDAVEVLARPERVLGRLDGALCDELTGATFRWGEHNYVRLDPFVEPAHVLTVRRGTA